MKYQVITKVNEKPDKENIKIHDDYACAVDSALDELEIASDWLCGSLDEDTLTLGYEKSAGELRRDGYTEFFNVSIAVVLLAMSQSWFRLGRRTSASQQCCWKSELIIQETDRTLTKIAKAVSVLEADPTIREVTLKDSGMWLDETETSLFADIESVGDIHITIDRHSLSVRLFGASDKTYWADYNIADMP